MGSIMLRPVDADQRRRAFAGSKSRHPGGVNALMGDGSVRFFKATISQPIWIAVNSMSNGEVIDASSY
jgi:prepilin-type processing-associated H-X9-DG protein